MFNKLSATFLTVLVTSSVPCRAETVLESRAGSAPSSGSSASLVAQKTYDGGYPNATKVLLRVGNGGAGQSGLIGAFADAFIKHQVEVEHQDPFKVEWYLGDTTQSLGYLAAGGIDVAFTYNEAAELMSVKNGAAVKRELVFIDHFYLVGPPSNPAGLKPGNDSVSDMFNKFVVGGNADIATPPADRPPTRFLSRYDKSATNIKESELFIKIGQVPWALAYSSWYHQYPRFPLQALQAASLLSEYTLTDRGTWLSSNQSVTDALTIYERGEEGGATEVLLNPCNALLGALPLDKDVSKVFIDWLVAADGGQKVVAEFKKNGEVLYKPARP